MATSKRSPPTVRPPSSLRLPPHLRHTPTPLPLPSAINRCSGPRQLHRRLPNASATAHHRAAASAGPPRRHRHGRRQHHYTLPLQACGPSPLPLPLSLLCCSDGGWRMEWAGGPIDGAVQVAPTPKQNKRCLSLRLFILPPHSPRMCPVCCCRCFSLPRRTWYQPIPRPHHRSRAPSLHSCGVTGRPALQQHLVARPVPLPHFLAQGLGTTSPFFSAMTCDTPHYNGL
jgi:hypothetical protein